MSGRQSQFYNIQEYRLSYYPKDRIPFLPGSVAAASADQMAIKIFAEGKIGFDTLKMYFERNNYLPEDSLSDEAVRKFLRSIGEPRIARDD